MSEPAVKRSISISLQAALLALIGLALLAGVVPAGIRLDRWVAREVEVRAWRDVELAPAIFADRNRAVGDALMMHAKDVAHTPALVAALAQRDRAQAQRVADDAARVMQHSAVLVDGTGAAWHGPTPPAPLIEATRRGEMPVSVVADSSGLYVISIAPVQQNGHWIGAAGVASPLDEAAAGALAALTRSDLVIVFTGDAGRAVLSTNLPEANQILRNIETQGLTDGVRELRLNQRRYLFTVASFAAINVAFVRDLRRDLAILPQLRRVLTANGAGALLIALLLGSLLALVLLRPVRVLAAAAERLSAGDFTAPLPASPVREINRVSSAFGAMRSSLSARIEELRGANRLLEERQARLSALQSELIRKERVAVSGRMVAELAHEIRNPVANLRNCLELIYRRLDNDPQAREYASLAIDELLRMHELAERMLDLNRPHSHNQTTCNPAQVAHEVAALTRVGAGASLASIAVHSEGAVAAAIPPDALKQVLLNLVQNAREAVPDGLRLDLEISGDENGTVIEVSDNGPGVPVETRGHVFDPFFTTRASAGGVGLGLFIVEGIVRGHGGAVTVKQGASSGACFRISLPAAVRVQGVESAASAIEKVSG
jgi:signal transduction histidine kinase